MKHFVDPDKRPIQHDIDFDNNDNYLSEVDIPEDSFESNVNENEVIPIDNETVFEVEKRILKTRTRNKRKEFLIRWKGFTRSSDSWEPEENINQQLVKDFLSKHQNK